LCHVDTITVIFSSNLKSYHDGTTFSLVYFCEKEKLHKFDK